MADELSIPLTVEQIYGDWGLEWEDAVAVADRSPGPRPRSSMYETLSSLGVSDGSYLLDIGGRDGAQALDLAERFRCRVLSVDPVQANLDAGVEPIADHEYGHLVESRLGSIDDVPAGDDTFEAIFSRDMMGHVEDLEGALGECRRVLKPGGVMVIHDVFSTPMLEPAESARLCSDLAQVPERLDVELFERIVEEAGFVIEVVDRVGSEWLEHLLEGEDGEKRLLRVARLHRDRDRFVEAMGAVPYRVVQANDLWTIYRMIGKLEDRVYGIRTKGATTGSKGPSHTA
ncbi:MAG: methyltransferase domain-containing protein [Actinomycetia bacterium]|nr:methyltransferase domain-containing protein [Actinomycetes bacterium]